jgi:hypothetical protein
MKSVRVSTVSVCSHNGWRPSTAACLECARMWYVDGKKLPTTTICMPAASPLLDAPHSVTVRVAIKPTETR